MQVRKQQLEPDMEETGSKLGKEYVKAVYCHPAYLTCMQSTSCEMLGWKKHKLESRLPRESWLKVQHSENEDHGIWSHYFIANRWGQTLFFRAPISLRMVTAAMKLKDAYSLEGKL